MEEYMEIGQIVNTSGIKGLIKINPYTDNIKRFDKLKKIYVEKNKQLIEYEIEYVRYTKNLVLLKLKTIETIEEAEKLRNCNVKIDRKDAIKLKKDSYFIADLIGINVFDENNNLIGILEDIFNTGSNDVYVVKDKLGKQILLPAIKSVVKVVDLENKKIIVNLMKGLI